MKFLQFLDISYNNVDKLTVLSFDGLSNLQTLNLSNNYLTTTHFPKDVFKPLITLKELDIRHNFQNETFEQKNYPDEVLKDLTSLEVLRLDCLNSKYQQLFRWGFKVLIAIFLLSCSSHSQQVASVTSWSIWYIIRRGSHCRNHPAFTDRRSKIQVRYAAIRTLMSRKHA